MSCIICHRGYCAHYMHTMKLQKRYKPAIDLLRLAQVLAAKIDDELEAETKAEEDKMEATVTATSIYTVTGMEAGIPIKSANEKEAKDNG